jgi:hypothetical protein
MDKSEDPPRISRLSKDQVDAETAGIFEKYLKERGNVPTQSFQRCPPHGTDKTLSSGQ